MLSFPPAVRIWLGSQPVDLRRRFDGLAEQVRQYLQADPLSGHVFVFRNKRSDRVKLLYWDEDGFVIVSKRLEAGTFRRPAPVEGQTSVTLRAAELAMLLDGIDWQHAQRSRRYHRPASRLGSRSPPRGWPDGHELRLALTRLQDFADQIKKGVGRSGLGDASRGNPRRGEAGRDQRPRRPDRLPGGTSPFC
jgi:transposase